MNILLVITNINGFHEIPYSFGLSSIASYIKREGTIPKFYQYVKKMNMMSFVRK